jgi:DNA-binding CsgD family transcriptional regulator
MGARNESVDQFERAARFAEDLEPVERAELFEALAEALYTTSRYADAITAWTEASAARRAVGDTRSAAFNTANLAFANWYEGRADVASRLVGEAIAALEPFGDGPELAWALAISSRLGMLGGDHERGMPAALRAMEIGRRIADPRSIADAEVSWATMLLEQGHETGFAALVDAYTIAESAGLPTISDRALNNLGVSASSWRRLADADRWFALREDHAERSEVAACVGDSGRGEVAILRGDWSTGEALLRIAIQATRTNVLSRSGSKAVLGRLAMLRGADDWREWLAEAEAVAPGFGTTQLDWPLAAIEAEAAWLGVGRDPELPTVRAAYEEARERADPWFIGELGTWLWRCGRLDTIDPRAAEPYRLEVAGRIAEAAAIWRGYEMPYEEAAALMSSADPADVGRAHAIFSELGGVRPATKAAARLRELGGAVPRGPRATTRSNPAGLTEREAEIARLVADGLTNAEIADRLVVSPRTVGHHVSAVLGKLGVPSRAAVGAVISQANGSR